MSASDDDDDDHLELEGGGEADFWGRVRAFLAVLSLYFKQLQKKHLKDVLVLGFSSTGCCIF